MRTAIKKYESLNITYLNNKEVLETKRELESEIEEQYHNLQKANEEKSKEVCIELLEEKLAVL